MRRTQISEQSFGGLQMMVRSEIDACADPLLLSSSPFSHKFTTTPAVGIAQDPQLHPLTIEHSGQSVQQCSIIEISTKVSHKIAYLHYGEIYSQMFWSQIPRLYVGLHRMGNFTGVKKISLEEVLERVGADLAKERMQKTKVLIEEILALMEGRDGETVQLVFERGVLQAFGSKKV